MVTEKRNFQTVPLIWGATRTEKKVVMGSTVGLMEVPTKVSLGTTCLMGKVLMCGQMVELYPY